jgi:hypothetical protein
MFWVVDTRQTFRYLPKILISLASSSSEQIIMGGKKNLLRHFNTNVGRTKPAGKYAFR